MGELVSSSQDQEVYMRDLGLCLPMDPGHPLVHPVKIRNLVTTQDLQ